MKTFVLSASNYIAIIMQSFSHLDYEENLENIITMAPGVSHI